MIRSFGHADGAANAPLNADKTLFLLGSIGKTFTAMAVHQLVERGEIHSIDDPVNRYLQRYRLDDNRAEEIRIRHLLSHTAGFEGSNAGLAATSDTTQAVTGTLIRRFQPELSFPVDSYVSYSNFGPALLGVLVEDVSGQPIMDYLRQHLFAPMGMHSVRALTRAADWTGVVAPGTAEILPFNPFVIPSGGFAAAPGDLQRYLITHLNQGRNLERQVLSAEGFAELYRVRARNHAAVSGVGSIFLSRDWAGRRLVEHTGSWPGHYAILSILPELGFGFFVGIAGTGSTQAPPMTAVEVRTRLLDYVLGPALSPQTPIINQQNLSGYVGSYLETRYVTSSMERLLGLRGRGVLEVTVDDHGALAFNGRSGYLPIANHVFWNPDVPPAQAGERLYAFTTDARGNIKHVTPYFGTSAFIPVSPIENPSLHLYWFGWLFWLSVLGLAGFWYLHRRGVHRGLRGAVALPVALSGLLYLLLKGDVPGSIDITNLLTGQAGLWLLLAILSWLFTLLYGCIAGLTLTRRAWQGGAATNSLAGSVALFVICAALLLQVALLYYYRVLPVDLPF